METLTKLSNDPIVLLITTAVLFYLTAKALKYVFGILSYYNEENDFEN
jgi:uncharacterized membrane protein